MPPFLPDPRTRNCHSLGHLLVLADTGLDIIIMITTKGLSINDVMLFRGVLSHTPTSFCHQKSLLLTPPPPLVTRNLFLDLPPLSSNNTF